MKTRYAITKIDKSGLRTLATANQGRCFRDTKAEAESHLAAILENNNEDTLRSVYGDVSKMKVLEVECYDNGDATRTVFEDVPPRLSAKLNKRERKTAQLLAHYETCERLALALGMPAAKVDGKKISVALFKLERDATAVSTALCNGERIRVHQFGTKPVHQIPEDFDANDENASERLTVRVQDALRNILGSIPPGFFVNGDPRGYALKIDNEAPEGRVLIEAVKMHTDLGGFGILSPEITGD